MQIFIYFSKNCYNGIRFGCNNRYNKNYFNNSTSPDGICVHSLQRSRHFALKSAVMLFLFSLVSRINIRLPSMMYDRVNAV